MMHCRSGERGRGSPRTRAIRVCPVGWTRFRQDLLDVPLDGSLGHDETLGDRGVRQELGDELKDLELSVRQRRTRDGGLVSRGLQRDSL